MEDTVFNFKCIHCGNVYSTLRGIGSHVRQIHQKKFRHNDFEPTTEKARPLVYGKSRSRAARAAKAQIDCLTPIMSVSIAARCSVLSSRLPGISVGDTKNNLNQRTTSERQKRRCRLA